VPSIHEFAFIFRAFVEQEVVQNENMMC